MKYFLLIITVLFFFFIVSIGVTKNEKNQCYKWQEQAKEYNGFFLLDWQKEQCEFLKINVLDQ